MARAEEEEQGSQDAPPLGSEGNTSANQPDAEAPAMGGLQKQSEDTRAPWARGKPPLDWPGLEEKSPQVMHPTQFRPASVGSAAKAQVHCAAGMPKKFGRKSDLLTFQLKMMEHLEKCGLDTIAHLKDPADETKMACIIAHRDRCALREAHGCNDCRRFAIAQSR